MNEPRPQFECECPTCGTTFPASAHRVKHAGHCEWCADPFESTNPRARFCSRRCQMDNYNADRRTGRPTGRPPSR